MKTIELLPVNEFKVLKVIQVIGPEWNLFMGYLPYLRKYNHGIYDAKVGDLLDKEILTTIQQSLPKSNMAYSNEILLKGELEERLEYLKGGSSQKIIIKLFPHIPYELLNQFVGKTFKEYPFNLSLQMHWKNRAEAEKNIQNYFMCYIPYDRIDEIAHTMEEVKLGAD